MRHIEEGEMGEGGSMYGRDKKCIRNVGWEALRYGRQASVGGKYAMDVEEIGC
jgi:hypothetical protein